MKNTKYNDILRLRLWDLIPLAFVVAVLAAFFAFGCFRGNSAGQTVTVEVDGKTVAELPLDKDTQYLIKGFGGGTNLLVIEDGRAYISEASCPDHICINTGCVTETMPLVCRPNRVIVYLGEAKP